MYFTGHVFDNFDVVKSLFRGVRFTRIFSKSRNKWPPLSFNDRIKWRCNLSNLRDSCEIMANLVKKVTLI